VSGSTGNETINNYNLITGSVNLDGGTNAFNNKSTGVFVSGATVNLGADNNFTNAGNLTPGGLGVEQTTTLTGNFVQTSTGVFTVDIDHNLNDFLAVSGTITFDGKVMANVFALPSASGGAMIADGTSVALAPTATADGSTTTDFSLQVIAGNELWLTWVPVDIFDLFTDKVTPNQFSIGTYFNALRQSPDTSAPLLALINAVKALPNEADVLAALDRLQPEHYLAQVNDTWISSQFFVTSLMSCPTASGEETVVTEGQCLWAKIGGRVFDQDHTRTNIGGDDKAYTVSAGAQVALDETWRFGFAGSYEETELTTTNKAHSDGQRGQGGFVLKNRWGPVALATAAFAGYGTFDTHRTIGLVGIGTADGNDDIRYGGGHSRLSFVHQDEEAYVKLMWDLDATYLEYGDFNETNGGVAGLHILGTSDWVFSTTGAVELGGNFESDEGTLRPYVRAAITAANDADFSLTSSFLAAPAGVSPFTITSHFDSAYLDVAAGLDVIMTGGLEIKLNYDGRFSDSSELHAGSLKAGVKF
jgi:hypothetical protein